MLRSLDGAKGEPDGKLATLLSSIHLQVLRENARLHAATIRLPDPEPVLPDIEIDLSEDDLAQLDAQYALADAA